VAYAGALRVWERTDAPTDEEHEALAALAAAGLRLRAAAEHVVRPTPEPPAASMSFSSSAVPDHAETPDAVAAIRVLAQRAGLVEGTVPSEVVAHYLAVAHWAPTQAGLVRAVAEDTARMDAAGAYLDRKLATHPHGR
jgi:hypothetical protein